MLMVPCRFLGRPLLTPSTSSISASLPRSFSSFSSSPLTFNPLSPSSLLPKASPSSPDPLLLVQRPYHSSGCTSRKKPQPVSEQGSSTSAPSEGKKDAAKSKPKWTPVVKLPHHDDPVSPKRAKVNRSTHEATQQADFLERKPEVLLFEGPPKYLRRLWIYNVYALTLPISFGAMYPLADMYLTGMMHTMLIPTIFIVTAMSFTARWFWGKYVPQRLTLKAGWKTLEFHKFGAVSLTPRTMELKDLDTVDFQINEEGFYFKKKGHFVWNFLDQRGGGDVKDPKLLKDILLGKFTKKPKSPGHPAAQAAAKKVFISKSNH